MRGSAGSETSFCPLRTHTQQQDKTRKEREKKKKAQSEGCSAMLFSHVRIARPSSTLTKYTHLSKFCPLCHSASGQCQPSFCYGLHCILTVGLLLFTLLSAG